MPKDDSKKIKPRIKVDSTGRVTLSKSDLLKLKKELPKKVEIGEAKEPVPDEVFDSPEKVLIPTLEEGANNISVPLKGENIVAFARYAELLREWNKVMNLTNIVDDNGIALRHFIDSLTIVNLVEKEMSKNRNTSLIDVGTGAGFPGIPLKIVIPDLEVTLLDSLNKRLNFLNTVVNELGLQKVKTVHARAEDGGSDMKHREKYDIATARAVASLPTLAEYCMPFVKVGGCFIAMKSHADEEIEVASKAIKILGGKIESIEEFCLPNTDIKRTVIVVRKISKTPSKYPRQAGKPSKEPL